MQFLKTLFAAFRGWPLTARQATEPASGLECTAPSFVSPGGHVARFVFRERDLYKSGSSVGLPKPGAFGIDTHPETGRHEVSVCGLTNVQHDRLWHLGRTIRQQEGLTALAALRLGVEPVAKLDLSCEAAPELPHFPEHGVIVGWPAGDDDKSSRQILQTSLAALVTPSDVLRPSAPATAP